MTPQQVKKQLSVRWLLPFLLLVVLSGRSFAQYSADNQVLSLNGNGYISVPYSSAFNVDLNQYGSLSIDAWVYPSSYSGVPTIVGNNWTTGYWLGLNTTGKVRFYPRGGLMYEGNATVPLNQWTHIGVSFDARKLSLLIYVNGALDASYSVPTGGVGFVTSGDLRIGADRSGASPSYYWNGLIDEVRIWHDQIAFNSALGLLYRVPHAVFNGLHGDDLVAGWRLNGSALGIGTQHNGSLVGTGSYASSPDPPHYPRIGAMFLNTPGSTAPGSLDYLSVPSSSGNSLVQNYTLECWVKPASTNGSTAFQTFISKGSLYTSQWTYWLGLNKSNGRVRFVPNGDFTDGLESPSSIPLNSWTHVCATYQVVGNTRTARLYINGSQVSTKQYSRNATANSYPLLIGRSDDGNLSEEYGFSGIIDEVRIWNAVRTAAEIQNNYNIELDGPLANLTGSYHFNGDIIDASTAGNHGDHLLASSSLVYFVSTTDLPPQPTIQVLIPNGGESWIIGTTRTIQWSSTGLQSVRILLSRDGGQTYSETLTASTSASTGAFNWVVTGPTTKTVRVLVTTTTPTPISDESNADFEIREPPPVVSPNPTSLAFTAPSQGPLPPSQMVILTNTGGSLLQWTASVTQPWLAVSPVGGTANLDSFEVSINTTNLAEGSYSDQITIGGNATNAGLKIPVIYRVSSKRIFSIAGTVRLGTAPMRDVLVQLSGDASQILFTDVNGAYAFPGLPEGSYNVEPSSLFHDFTPPNRKYDPLDANITDANFTARGKRSRIMFRYKEGWNLLALPLTPDNASLAGLFTDAESPAYFYNPATGYEPTTTLAFGTAYWIKFMRTDSTEVSGTLEQTIDHNLTASQGGWNMIGGPSGPVDISAIEQSPAGSIVAVFEYDPHIGYFNPVGNQIRPGRGYFVKSIANALARMQAVSLFAPWIPLPSLRFPGTGTIRDLPPPPPSE